MCAFCLYAGVCLCQGCRSSVHFGALSCWHGFQPRFLDPKRSKSGLETTPTRRYILKLTAIVPKTLHTPSSGINLQF